MCVCVMYAIGRSSLAASKNDCTFECCTVIQCTCARTVLYSIRKYIAVYTARAKHWLFVITTSQPTFAGAFAAASSQPAPSALRALAFRAHELCERVAMCMCRYFSVSDACAYSACVGLSSVPSDGN